MCKLGLGWDERCFSCDTEDLLKVEALALVGEVENLAGMEILLALNDGGKIGRGVERCAVGL